MNKLTMKDILIIEIKKQTKQFKKICFKKDNVDFKGQEHKTF